jgi:peptidoglycan hydrolase-like protein with peptidoglycan-binding domain
MQLKWLAPAVVAVIAGCTKTAPPPAPPAVPPAPVAPTPAPLRITPQMLLIRSIQTELIRLGFYNGAPDGLLGPKTRNAISDFQKSKQIPEDGMASQWLLGILKAS